MNPSQKYFDSVAASYNEDSRRGFWRVVRNIESKAFMKLLNSGRYDKAVDLGSGSGHYSGLIRPRCQELYCVDFSRKMLDLIPFSCFKVESDITCFGPGFYFDLVICAGSLEFSSHPNEVFKKMAELSHSEGEIVCLVPRFSLLGFFYKIFHLSHGVKVHLFREKELHQLARRNGLKVEVLQRIPLFSMVFKLKHKEAS